MYWCGNGFESRNGVDVFVCDLLFHSAVVVVSPQLRALLAIYYL